MNSKMTTYSQLPRTDPKKQNQKQARQTIRTGTDPEKWRSHGGLSAWRGPGECGGKGIGNKKHNW